MPAVETKEAEARMVCRGCAVVVDISAWLALTQFRGVCEAKK